MLFFQDERRRPEGFVIVRARGAGPRAISSRGGRHTLYTQKGYLPPSPEGSDDPGVSV